MVHCQSLVKQGDEGMMGLVGEGNERSVAERTSALAFLTHLLVENRKSIGRGAST